MPRNFESTETGKRQEPHIFSGCNVSFMSGRPYLHKVEILLVPQDAVSSSLAGCFSSLAHITVFWWHWVKMRIWHEWLYNPWLITPLSTLIASLLRRGPPFSKQHFPSFSDWLSHPLPAADCLRLHMIIYIFYVHLRGCVVSYSIGNRAREHGQSVQYPKCVAIHEKCSKNQLFHRPLSQCARDFDTSKRMHKAYN